MTVLNVMIGPPEQKKDDNIIIEKFLSSEGRHFICGGTTATLVANYLHTDISIPINVSGDCTVPHGIIGNKITVMEGVITLMNVANAFKNKIAPQKGTGEHLLYTALIESQTINFFLGRAINPLHNNEICFERKEQSVLYIKEELTKLNKTVNLYQN